MWTKVLRLFFFFCGLIVLTHVSVQASEQSMKSGETCCICQTGTGMAFELPFFDVGCKIWLAQQSGCDMKKTVKYQRDSLSYIPRSCDGGEVRLGFVGHWNSTRQTINFLEPLIEEGMFRRKMSFDIDNTACFAMDRPNDLKNFFDYKQQLPAEQFLRFRGNQVLSVGTWDDIPFAFGSSNFYAIYDSRTGQVTYPNCSEFRGEVCSATFGIQKGQRGQCINEQGELEILECCGARYYGDTFRRLSRGSYRTRTEGITSNRWMSPRQCGQAVN